MNNIQCIESKVSRELKLEAKQQAKELRAKEEREERERGKQHVE